jgi:hypothetical protein
LNRWFLPGKLAGDQTLEKPVFTQQLGAVQLTTILLLTSPMDIRCGTGAFSLITFPFRNGEDLTGVPVMLLL